MTKVFSCSQNSMAQASMPSHQKTSSPLTVEKVKERWKEWNTSLISSSERQARKINSLHALAKDLSSNDPSLAASVERIKRDFFAQGLDKSSNAVQTLLNHYCNFAEPISCKLAELADEQLICNTWRSS